uniref:Uncharacterized protein n=1 Tax=Arundo donax TaxID=35708 RepID=A0A0A9CH20_ARUDO
MYVQLQNVFCVKNDGFIDQRNFSLASKWCLFL